MDKQRAPSIFPIRKFSQKNSLIRKQSPKSIHPLNNVVKTFFGKKGFINFLNIIRRSLKGKKGDNSISFKQDLISELLAIKQKFKICHANSGHEKEQQVSQYLANTDQGEEVTFAGQDVIVQEQANFPDSVSESDIGSLLMRPSVNNIKFSEPNSRRQSQYIQQIEAARTKQSHNLLVLDRFASTKSQKSSRSVSTLPQTSILNFKFTSYRVCRDFYQFHYFCASHLERYGDKNMKNQVLDCYIDGGKIQNECVPGKIIESYLQELNKAQIQTLHGKFFKLVIKTKPLLSRIISKIKQQKSKAMLKDKIYRLKMDNMMNARGSISTDFQNISKLDGIKNFSIDEKLSRNHFGRTQQIDESLKLSIEALKELSKQIKSSEDKYEKKKKKKEQGNQIYKSKQLTKITLKYVNKYSSLDNFPKDDESRAMFLLNTINFTILIRLIESMNKPNGAPVNVYLWSQFLKQASLVINRRKFNLLELINVFLRNEASRMYHTPQISEMLKWPKYCDLQYKSQLDGDLTVREKYHDISMGIHFPLKQMPGFHIFTKQHKLQDQLQKIKSQFINRHMKFEVNENTQKIIVTVPKYFEWFLIDYVGEADVVERQSIFIAEILNLSLDDKFSQLRKNFANTEMATSLQHSPVKWIAYKRLCV